MKDRRYVTAVPLWAEHIMVNALRRIGHKHHKFDIVKSKELNKIILYFIDEGEMTEASLNIEIPRLRYYVRGFLSGAEYCHTNGIDA